MVKRSCKILPLELFLTSHSARVREIAIECKKDVLDFGIHRMVKALKRIGTRCNLVERGIHLCHIFEIDGYMPLRQLWWSEAEFSPGNAITSHRSYGLQVIQIGTGFFDELDIANALFKIEPDVIYVHRYHRTSDLQCGIVSASSA